MSESDWTNCQWADDSMQHPIPKETRIAILTHFLNSYIPNIKNNYLAARHAKT